MKKIKLSNKLNLNKTTISGLNIEESKNVKGGSCMTHCFCEPTRDGKCESYFKVCFPSKKCGSDYLKCEIPTIMTE